MRSLKVVALGAALGVSLIGASSGSAANWDPQNTNLQAAGTNSSLTDTSGQSVSSTSVSATVRASGAVASTVAVGGQPVTFDGNTSSLGGTVTVATFGTWTFIATSTTSVDIVAHPDASGRIATIQIHTLLGTCDVSVDGPLSIPNNTWSNATRQLTVNNGFEFTSTPSASCFGALTGENRFDASVTLPVGTQIT